MSRIDIYGVSETTGMVDIPGAADIEVQRRIWWLADHFRGYPGAREVVPGMNNLTVELDPAAADLDKLLQDLRKGWLESNAATLTSRRIEIPVEYGGAAGPDLDEVARHAELPAAEVIRLHCSGEYTVFFLGFLPGFAYLGGLDKRLAMPRLAEPRLIVPAGSVGIGGDQTGIYPLASPGGWRLIGRTSLRLFDPSVIPPSRLLPGDTVTFVQVGERR
jgi:KipI family sensor histidine kinase inhibitor